MFNRGIKTYHLKLIAVEKEIRCIRGIFYQVIPMAKMQKRILYCAPENLYNKIEKN